MKKKLKKALTPQKTFEEWARDNDVELQQYSPVTKKQCLFKRIRRWKLVIGVSAMAVCLAFAAVLFVVLSFGTGTENPPKIYTAQNSVREDIGLNKLYQTEGLLLFDRGQIKRCLFCYDLSVNKYRAVDNEALILGYSVEDVPFRVSDGDNCFYVGYTIRLYKYYEFTGHSDYSGLANNFLEGGTKISYKIVEENQEKTAYIGFVYESVEYFIRVTGCRDVTDITEDTLRILIGDLFNGT